MAYGCAGTSSSKFTQPLGTSFKSKLSSSAIPSTPYVRSLYSQPTQSTDPKIVSFTIESQLYYSLIDPSKLVQTEAPRGAYKLSELLDVGILPKTLDPDGKGYYQTTITWQQMGQSVTLTLLMGCLEKSLDKFIDQPCPTDGSARDPYPIASCFALSPGTISSNKSMLYAGRSEHKYFDDSFRILIDIDYTLNNAENHLAGELSFDPFYEAEALIRGAECVANCTDSCTGGLACIGDTVNDVACTYSCDDHIDGDFSFSYGAYYGPETRSNITAKHFQEDYDKRNPPPRKVEFVPPENKKFTYVYDPYSPIDPYAKP